MTSKRGAAFVALVVTMIVLGSSAREPIKRPPAAPVIESKTVRARDLGIPFEGTPGKLNAITDVPGVEVGYTTLISGEGKLEVGKGPVRTGVTAILPRGPASLNDPVYAGFFSLNGNGEMTGTAWVDESGFLEGPIIITNTHSVGVARDAVIAWRVRHGAADKTGYWWSLPVVAETWDRLAQDRHSDFERRSAAEFHRRRVFTGKLRSPPAAHHRGCTGGQGDSRRSLQGRKWLLHRGSCDRRTAAANSIEAPRAACFARPGAHGLNFRKWLR